MIHEKTYEGPAMYQITVQGTIDHLVAQLLGDMVLYHSKTKGQEISSLIGEVEDQSQLFGVLNSLNDYHYSIISVTKINI